MTLPNFLIVGAAKAGTTSLYYYLKQHPDIGFPELKEPKFFSSISLTFPHQGTGDDTIDKYAIKTLEEYKKLFQGIQNKKMVGEASPDYIYYHEKVIPNIKQYLGDDTKIIIVLRDPTKRAFSAYSNLVRDSREKLSFKEALDIEEERLKNNWDWLWGYRTGGLYYQQVVAYMDGFSKVKVILLDDFQNNLQETIKDLLRFLEVDEGICIDTSTEHNPSGKPTNIFARFILSRDNQVSVNTRELLKKIVPRSILEKVSSMFLQKMDMAEEDAQYLKQYFKEDIEKLEQLINRDLTAWKK